MQDSNPRRDSHLLARGDYLLGGSLGACGAVWAGTGGLFALGGGALAGLILTSLISRLRWNTGPRLVIRLRTFAWVVACLGLGFKVPMIVRHEGWHRHLARLGQRLIWEQTSSIHPGCLYPGQPQRYFIRFQDELKVEDSTRFFGLLRVGSQETAVSVVPLGLRTAYLDLASIAGEAGATAQPATLEIERGERLERFHLAQIPPTPCVPWLEADPTGSFVAGCSQTTDALFLLRESGDVEEIAVGDGPTDLAHGPGGIVWVAHAFEPILLEVDGRLGRPLRALRLPASQTAVAVSRDGSRLAIALESDPMQLLLLELPSARVIKTIPLAARVRQLLPGRTADEWLFSQWTVRRLVQGRLTQQGWVENRLALPYPARRMALAVERGLVYFSSGGYAADVRDLLGNHQGEHHVAVWDLEQGTVTQVVDLKSNSPGLPEDGWVSGLDPAGVWVQDHTISVVGQGSRDLIRWEIDAPERRKRIELGQAGVVAPSDGATLANGAIWVTDPVGLQFFYFNTSGAGSTVKLKNSNFRDPGKIAFYRTTRAGLSCNSCHTDGGTDHVFHNIGSELVLTPPLSGIAHSAPFLRQAPHNSIADLHHDLAELILGGYRGEPPDVEALQRFVTTLPLEPNPLWSQDNATRMQAGYRAFEKAECTRCHPLPGFTQYSQHPEAWLFPNHRGSNPHRVLDVPSLRTIWQKSAFLYDGRGANVEIVLSDLSAGGRHGHYERLTPEEREALLLFLQAL